MDMLLGSGRFLARRPPLALTPRCSRGPPEKSGSDKGDTSSTDWDKAWSTFKKRGKKTLFSEFSPNKYVSWNPRRSEYPLSEEVACPGSMPDDVINLGDKHMGDKHSS
ncbi:hypothetical protein ABZP36_006519 [Zizania latifolia]